MTDAEKTPRAIDLWILDLALTAVSFLLAYRARVLFSVPGRQILPFEAYAPSLAVIAPTWAIVLPLFGVYSKQPSLRRLGAAVAAAWLAAIAAEFVLMKTEVFIYWTSSRVMQLFTLVINFCLLASYRLLLLRKESGRWL